MNGLRPYQEDAVGELRDAVRRHRSAVYVLPTGGGKTVVAAEVARLGVTRSSRTLLLVHRRELVRQAVDTLTASCPDVEVGVEAAGWRSWPVAPLQVGMVQSIVRRRWDVKPDIVIVDEAHHARAKTWENVLARWPAAARIGLTATPQRRDGKGLAEHFAVMVEGPTIPELVEGGWLAPVETYTIPVGLKLAGLKRDRGGEYRPGDVDQRVTTRVVAGAADAYLAHAGGRKAIFFGVTIRHSRSVCDELRRRGVRAEHVDGGDPVSRRDRIMDEFRDGAVDVVCNADLISEGFDAPACEVVILGAPTRSVTRYLQQAGRCMRPAPGKVAAVLDLAGIVHSLGLPDEVRDWSLEDGERRPEPRRGTAVRRTCADCRRAFYGTVCPGCGHDAGGGVRVVERPTTLVAAAPARRMTSGLAERRRAAIREAIVAPSEGEARMVLAEFARRAHRPPGWADRVMVTNVLPTRRRLRRVRLPPRPT